MKRRKFIGAASMLPFLSGVKNSFAEADEAGAVAQPDEETGPGFFYRPKNAWAADFIPFYAENAFQLFFLLDWRDEKKYGEGTPWYRISTDDFVQFKEHGEALPRGTKEEQDLYVFTGSAIRANNQYHIFYTGHNPHFIQKGKPQEAVMHAVSDDLVKWRKIPEDGFYALGGQYEKNDWRDPFVFWNEEAKEFQMLTAARFTEGIPRRRGLTAVSASKDLKHWEPRAPLYAPGLYFTHECPDLFRIGAWWYLIFSEFSDTVRTRYRMSKSLNGPWITPARDDFDGHAYYAAKTASDGKKRFLFGWNPTKSASKDEGNWNWGGNLVVHELVQQLNGELSVRMPDTVRKSFKNTLPLNFSKNSGNVQAGGNSVAIAAAGGFGASLMNDLPAVCLMEANLKFDKATQRCGLMLKSDPEFNQAYYIRLEPGRGRMTFDIYPRKESAVFEMVELSRDIELDAEKTHLIQVIIDGNKGVVYLDEEVAMNFRMYNLKTSACGFFAENGNARFSEISISVL